MSEKFGRRIECISLWDYFDGKGNSFINADVGVNCVMSVILDGVGCCW
jgi:hypothetical protein